MNLLSRSLRNFNGYLGFIFSIAEYGILLGKKKKPVLEELEFIKLLVMNPPKIKRRVGIYEVGRTIGEGTFAKVKFARNSVTGEAVALKILDKDKVLKHKMAEQVWSHVLQLHPFSFPL